MVCKVAPVNVKFPLLFALRHQAEGAVVASGKLTIPIRFGFKAVTEDEKTEVLVITCRLEVVYELAEGYEPTSEQIDAFSQGNAVFNCWSYFREYVQNSVARIGYPPVTIPFLRMVPKPEPAIASDALKIPRSEPAKIEPPVAQQIPSGRKRRLSREV